MWTIRYFMIGTMYKKTKIKQSYKYIHIYIVLQSCWYFIGASKGKKIGIQTWVWFGVKIEILCKYKGNMYK